MPKQIISASEMERYGYCPLSWYLDLRGIDAEGDEVNTGVEKHKVIGDSLKNLLVEEEKSRETSTTLMVIVGLIMTVVTIALIILWLSTDVLRQNMGVILLIIGIGWMLIAAFFLYKLLLSTEKIDQLRDDYNLGEETIETPDGLTEETPVLKSRKYNLAGRPDYMIKENNLRIPVEVKTGRRPKAPFFSHVLQIGAYCLLSEETFRTSPSHGQIRYGFENEPHNVEWEPKLKTLVIEKIEEMNDIREGRTKAHRNHKRVGKCNSCSRRKGCPERLRN
ncbi:MAG: Dna2/Cas4 domain-containing protein [Candidatus Poseidoniia archaeon]|jgi:CRISPR-associated exonuclease Cas4|nr:Dna2/Cas4 domain-containing protein [Candidatus Poseidoniia archaeon]MDP7096269.1 Dna2/Cas4 domain-containing protein [Candidatus Poseidoniia archaeon]MDP7187580.1 Dna2/Cas4 domain-containing protein [Candidatus Poseidoniia archaeon]MDP7444711.1 Dna2/Cas4 domain-containing protein [Candidatus Poseidoniia archaeon]MDP7665775.1 Dna2/Cas4 domain-containing protein [Candidatus Poseidoniia archaeon]|tara:strand:- start:2974 stop:3807 length:834 start_codon:yes stop_codon:yes gene_type:complete